MPAFSELVLVGRVVKPQGRHGEVAVEPFSDREDRFPKLRARLRSRRPGARRARCKVERCWPHKHRFVLKLAGIDSIDAAETLRGAELRIAESELEALPEGSYYYHQLTGLRVDDEQGDRDRRRGERHGDGRRDARAGGARARGRDAAAVRRGLREIGRPRTRPHRRGAPGVRRCGLTSSRSSRACCSEPLADGIVGRARAAGLVEIHVHDLRDHTDDRHRSVDDAPFGGGPGMVMKAEPFARALEAIRAEAGPAARGRRAALAARPALRPADRAPLRGPRAAGAAVRALRGHRRARGAIARDRGAEPRGLRADGRRDGGTRGGRGHACACCRAPSGTRLRRETTRSRRVCSTGRTTRGPPSGAARACRRCCCRATTRASAPGAAASRLRATRERRPELFEAASLTREDEALVREIEDADRAGGPGALYKNPAVIHK